LGQNVIRRLSLLAPRPTFIAGVKARELDEHLAQIAKARGVPKPKLVA
jgi:hypothetical protein